MSLEKFRTQSLSPGIEIRRPKFGTMNASFRLGHQAIAPRSWISFAVSKINATTLHVRSSSLPQTESTSVFCFSTMECTYSKQPPRSASFSYPRMVSRIAPPSSAIVSVLILAPFKPVSGTIQNPSTFQFTFPNRSCGAYIASSSL